MRKIAHEPAQAGHRTARIEQRAHREQRPHRIPFARLQRDGPRLFSQVLASPIKADAKGSAFGGLDEDRERLPYQKLRRDVEQRRGAAIHLANRS
jgi:hypothetical protein